MSSGFHRDFKENPHCCGPAAPETLLGTLRATVANTAVILGRIDKLEKR